MTPSGSVVLVLFRVSIREIKVSPYKAPKRLIIQCVCVCVEPLLHQPEADSE